MREMPTISDAAHSHATYAGSDFGSAIGAGTGFIGIAGLNHTAAPPLVPTRSFLVGNATAMAAPIVPKPKEPKVSRRLVQVLIADPDENVPLSDAILYNGSQKLTDLTDQELFFEVDIKSVLDAHNAKRAKLINKKVKERTEFLEPARVRDLRMVVVTIASF